MLPTSLAAAYMMSSGLMQPPWAETDNPAALRINTFSTNVQTCVVVALANLPALAVRPFPIRKLQFLVDRAAERTTFR